MHQTQRDLECRAAWGLRNCGHLGGAEIARSLQAIVPWNAGHQALAERKQRKPRAAVLLSQLVLIAPITEYETSPGPIEANGKSLGLALQIHFSHY